MIYVSHYNSPIGDILLAAKDDKLIGLWIESQKYYLSSFKEKLQEVEDNSTLNKTKNWLARYFNGNKPSINELDLNPIGSDFRKSVWKILMDIPMS